MNKSASLVFILYILFSSCSKKETGTPQTVQFDLNNGNIDSGKVVIVPNTVNSNLNVNGTVIFTQTTSINGDLNQNNNGKIIISAEYDTSRIIISGNANWNDTVIIKKGIVVVTQDLNLNNRAVVNCYNTASIEVGNHLNQNGSFYGFKNIKKAAVINKNGAILIEDEPRNWD